MAMPSSIPPAASGGTGLGELLRLVAVPEAEPVTAVRSVANDDDLAEEVVALAKKMGDSVHDQIGDVLRRTKSRNWMVGRLRRSGLWSDEQIRAEIERQRKLYRPTISDELGHRDVQLTSRRPLRFLEASSWPAWGPRVDQIGALVVYPMTIHELTRRAEISLRWTENHVKQTVAAAEDAGELWYDLAFQHWHRTPERIVMSDPKKKTKTVRVQRHLPVELKGEDRAALTDRLRAASDEWDALMAELEEFKKSQRAKLQQAEDRRERIIEAITTGREVQLVECEERWAYEQREVTTVRKDTGAIVDRREMTQDELQLRIPESASA